jgi:DNA-binding IclR family transcriptional regulator
MPKQKTTARRIDFLSTVDRAMRVIEFLSDTEEGLSISELARRLGINKSIVFRILNTLESLRYLYQDKETQRYRLTYRISNLALRQLSSTRLLDQCAPVLRELAERTGELARLAIVENDRPVWIHAESGSKRTLGIDPVYGHEVVLHSHATGKALLLTMPDDEIERLLGNKPLTAYTKYTLTTSRAVKADIKASRGHGFAMSYEEHELGVGTVAAPIVATGMAGEQRCVGVVSLAAPTSRMDRAALTQCGDLVVEAANHLADVWPLQAAPRLTRRLAG